MQKSVAYANTPCPIERVFEFQDEAFRSYDQISSFRKARYSTLVQTYERMSESDHPVVAYAAGGLLTELCTSNRGLPLPWRHEAISTVAEHWDYAISRIPEYKQLARRSGNTPLIDRYSDLSVRIRIAKAHLPAVRAIAEKSCEDTDVQHYLDQTYDNLLQLASWVCKQRPKSLNKAKRLNGFAGELLVSALHHRGGQTDTIATNTTMRQDNNRKAKARADLVFHDFTHNEHTAALAQIKTNAQGNDTQKYAHTLLLETKDVNLPNCNSRGTLAELVDEYIGINQTDLESYERFHKRSASLDLLTFTVMSRVDNFLFNQRLARSSFRMRNPCSIKKART